MDTNRKKELQSSYKSRRPEMGVVELRCVATGERFLGTTRDGAKELNSLRAKLDGGLHPNRHLQELWTMHGADGFTFTLVDTLDYDDPAEVTLDDLRALRELLLADDPTARIIWK